MPPKTTGFQLRRPILNGYVAEIDHRPKAQLDALEGMLSADLFPNPVAPAGAQAARAAADGQQAAGDQQQQQRQDAPAGAPRRRGRNQQMAPQAAGQVAAPAARVAPAPDGLDPAPTLGSPLTPKRSRLADEEWAAGSLGATLEQKRQELEGEGQLNAEGNANSPDLVSLAKYVDRVPELSTLKYSVDEALEGEWSTYSEPVRRVLDNEVYPALRVYLVAYAYLVLGLKDVGAVKKFILTDSLGAESLINYAVIGAARELVADKGFNIADFDVDGSTFVEKVRSAHVGLSGVSFEQDVMAVINEVIDDVEHKELIEKAEEALGPMSLQTKMLLARYIDAYINDKQIKITPGNITTFAAIWLAQNAPPPPAVATEGAGAVGSGADFGIETYQDDPSSVQISQTAVLCAAQLYYTMVLGDELDVFAIVHYFTHKYLVDGVMEVTDPVLRSDLQNYVFSNRFTDLNSGRLLDRSRPAERKMFYRQVFGLGHGQVPEDLVMNDDFQPMWKQLMLQSATYLEKAQASLNPEGFVSKQQVAQAVEDLQYDLSTHCVGMATVATPLMYAELNFTIKRILKHPDVVKQVVPIGGTWWRVVERLYMDLKQTVPRSTAYYNKAKLGHDIIKQISEYNASTFEKDASFAEFISDVDAYITTQSILQAALTDDLKRHQESTAAPVTVQPQGEGPLTSAVPGAPGSLAAPGGPSGPSMPAPVPVGAGASAGDAAANGHAPADEWDF